MLTIDYHIYCDQDWDVDLFIEVKAPGSGLYVPLTGLAATMLLSATPGPDPAAATPIHASLVKSSAARLASPGQYHPSTPFEVDDLRLYLLPSYAHKVVYLNLFKSGDFFYKPFACLVRPNQLET